MSHARRRISTRALWTCIGIGVSLLATSASAQTIWYNGDLIGQSALRNQVSSSRIGARIFDDFVVPTGQLWHITSIWSNDWVSGGIFGRTTVRQADWSIRVGMSAGNGGIVMASGLSSVSQTFKSIPNFLYEEDTIRVSGLSIDLFPGTYWLQVTPVVGESYNSITTGANAIGTPKGNDKNSFFDWPSNGTNFAPQNSDFSMGIAGAVIPLPEPGPLALLAGFATSLLGASLRSSLRKRR